MITLNILLQAESPRFLGSVPSLGELLILIIILIYAISSSKMSRSNPPVNDQTNKVINIPMTAGLISLFISSPQKLLNDAIKIENANGWRVVQVIPADSGNLLLYISRLLLLCVTFFLYTTSNGYYVILEKN